MCFRTSIEVLATKLTQARFANLILIELSLAWIAVSESACEKTSTENPGDLKVDNQMRFKIKVDYVQPIFGM